MIAWQRFFLHDIQHGAADTLFIQRPADIRQRDQRSSAHIDKDRIRFHQRKQPMGKKTSGRRIGRDTQDDRIRDGKHFVQLRQRDHALHARHFLIRMCPHTDHVGSQMMETMRQRRTDVAHTDDHDRRSADHPHPLLFFPAVLLLPAHVTIQPLKHQDQRTDHIFTDDLSLIHI